MAAVVNSIASCSSSFTTANSQNTFLHSVNDHFMNVMKYENASLRASAKKCIPLTTLHIKALNRMREVQEHIKREATNDKEMCFDDAVLIELLDWFKTSFFQWVDSPPCKTCNNVTKYSHNLKMKSSSEDNIRVEVFLCDLCNTETLFPRYNDPGKLLQTRRGRCGEWANCFTLLCRALNYDARFVVDTTDHVWTEVYSFSMKKWLHCDPCENIIDIPLTYETGWGKKLEYVIAYSKDDVQDVTWRYTSNHKAILSRRNKCTEDELIRTILNLREIRWKSLTQARINYLRKRICQELVQLMTERKAGDAEKLGRISGSLNWRLGRRETKSMEPYTWTFNSYEKLSIRYKTASDMYEVTSPDGSIIKTAKSWENGVYEVKDVVRKKENDWKMVYLARAEKSDSANITWKIAAADGMTIDSINVNVCSQTYESGKVDWILGLGKATVAVPKQFERSYTLDHIRNLTEFTLTANMSGGSGNNAWQHSQILRQSLDGSEYPLQINVSFKKCGQ